MDGFHLLRPWWLLALFPWLVLCWRIWRRGGDRSGWSGVCDEALLPFILEGAASTRGTVGTALLALAGILAIVALAGPAWRELPQPVYRQQQALVIVLDLSRSMDVEDVMPSRLARARLKIRDLLRRRSDGQAALVVFAGEAFAVTPLTDDVNTIDALVPSLATDMMPVPGTRTDRGLDLASALLERAEARRGRVLLITDGGGSVGLDAAAAGLARAGHRLSVIGVGTTAGASIPAGDGGVVRDAEGRVVIPRLEEASLQSLARLGNGHYARLTVDDRDLDVVLDDAVPGWSAVTRIPGLTSDRWREEGPWLLLLLLPIASLMFRRGVLVLALVVALPLPKPAMALDWSTLWRNDDQRGARAFGAKHYARAGEAFRDPEWKAAALYRAGRFEQAAVVLAPLRHPRALYNRGNALARLGRREEAMVIYEQVLRVEPEHRDARHNLALLRALEPPSHRPGGGDGQDDSSAGGRRDEPSTRPEDASSKPRGGSKDSRDVGSAAREPGAPPTGQEPRRDGAHVTDDDTTEPAQAQDSPLSPADDLSRSDEASRRAMKQWLGRIKDDPGGLLRRKFRHQYSRRPAVDDANTAPW